MSSLDTHLHRVLRAANDEDVVTVRYQLPAGVVMATKVVMYMITDHDFDVIEHFVVRCGNPGQVVLKTEDADEANARYEAECRSADEEYRVWWEDHDAARR